MCSGDENGASNVLLHELAVHLILDDFGACASHSHGKHGHVSCSSEYSGALQYGAAWFDLAA